MLSLYAIQMLMENLNMILLLYYKYIMGYIVFSMFASFVVCYRYGPVTNPRSIDLIRWTLQVIIICIINIINLNKVFVIKQLKKTYNLLYKYSYLIF